MHGAARGALEHVRRLAVAAGGPQAPAGLLDQVRITVHFHPDRLLTDGRTVAEHLMSDGTSASSPPASPTVG
jgi:hypothetical protein